MDLLLFDLDEDPYVYDKDYITALLDNAEGYIQVFWIWFKFTLLYD